MNHSPLQTPRRIAALAVLLGFFVSGCAGSLDTPNPAKAATPELARGAAASAETTAAATIRTVEAVKAVTPANVSTAQPVALEAAQTAQKAATETVKATGGVVTSAVGDANKITAQAATITELKADDPIRDTFRWAAVSLCGLAALALVAAFVLKSVRLGELSGVLAALGFLSWGLYAWGRTISACVLLGLGAGAVVYGIIKWVAWHRLAQANAATSAAQAEADAATTHLAAVVTSIKASDAADPPSESQKQVRAAVQDATGTSAVVQAIKVGGAT